MHVHFHGAVADGSWKPVYAVVKDEKELDRLSREWVDNGLVTALEAITRWTDTGLLTGPMSNYCLTFNCQVCKGRTA
jgi:hypothetical protein